MASPQRIGGTGLRSLGLAVGLTVGLAVRLGLLRNVDAGVGDSGRGES
jgi:hypothetical protein